MNKHHRSSPCRTQHLRDSDNRTAVRIFVCLFLAYALFTNLYPTTDDFPRLCMTAAIVEEHRFEIDSFYDPLNRFPQWDTCNLTGYKWRAADYSVYNGHKYSDKALWCLFWQPPFIWLQEYSQMM